MRTTVELPPRLHQRARELAERNGLSMSAVVADLAARGLAQLDEPVVVTMDEVTGFPVIDIGRPVTSDEVGDLVEEE